MKVISYLICIFFLSNVSAQQIHFEDEKQNKAFNQAHRKAKPTRLFEQADGDVIAWYESISYSGRQVPTHTFRLFSSKLRQKRVVVQDLPKDVYLSAVHQFADGNILALLYEVIDRHTIITYTAKFNPEKLKIELRQKNKTNTYSIEKYNRAEILSGALFRIVVNSKGNFAVIISSGQKKMKENRKFSYQIINSEGESIANSTYEIPVRARWSEINSFNISPAGQLYFVYQDRSDDRRGGEKNYLVDVLNNRRTVIAQSTQSLNGPALYSGLNDNKLLTFCTYAVDRHAHVDREVQGLYLSSYDISSQALKETFLPFPKDILNKIYNGRSRKVRIGDLDNKYHIKLLSEYEQDQIYFLIESHYEQVRRNPDGSVRTRYFLSKSALIGSISLSNLEYSWLDVIKKEEKINARNAVGSFVFIDKENHVNVLINSNKEKAGKKRSPESIYANRQHGAAQIVHIRYDEEGNRKDRNLIQSRKDIGYYFESRRAYYNRISREAYLILYKRNKEIIGRFIP